MNRRRATSLSEFIQRNMRYITRLRSKVRNLEEEEAELSRRLSLLLADVDVNRAENNDLRSFLQEVEQQVQLQDALNFSLQEEIRNLRQLTDEIEPNRVSLDLVESEPSTSQGDQATVDDKPRPKDQKGK